MKTPPPNHHQPYAAAAAPRPGPRPPRTSGWRRALAALGLQAATVLALLGALWWWAGTGTSLATTLTRVAPYLPAGQSLQVRDVSGSLRAGGHISWLRWSSPTLAVEVRDARIAWQLAPLLHRQLRLDELHAARLTLTPQGTPSPEPAAPLDQLVLPVQVETPFGVDRIVWAGADADRKSDTDANADASAGALTIDGLRGSYRYDGAQHRLAVDQVSLAQGRYALLATLQAQAPMALDATASGTVRTPVPGGTQTLEAQAQATVQGQLATAGARLDVAAQLRGTASDAAPALRADLRARIAPWAPQPLLQAAADLQALDLSALWPQAPATQLSGSASAEPVDAADGATGWRLAADLRNTLPGPWDRQRLPLDALQAQAAFDGTTWTLAGATLRVGPGSVAAQGAYTPGTQALQGQVRLQALNPASLHTALDTAPLSGTASAAGEASGAVRFTADLRAAPAAARRGARQGGAAPLRLERLAAQGSWQGERIDIARLDIDALQAQVRAQSLRIATAGLSAQGRVQANVPGATAQADGQIAPASGGGTLALRLSDAQRTQQWLATLPVALAPLAAWRLDGNAELNARWNGGWQALQRQLHTAGLLAGEAPAQAGRFELQAQLNAPRLRVAQAPRPDTGDAPPPLELLRTTAALRGSVPQAALELDGTLRQGPQQLQMHLRAGAGGTGNGRWQAQVSALNVQATVDKHSGPWSLRLDQPLTLAAQTSPRLQVDASAGLARITGPQPGEAQLRWQPLRYAQGAQGAAQLRSQGELQGLPLAWANAFDLQGQPALTQLGLAGNLVLGAAWDIDAADTLRARASLRRSSGDLRILTGDAAPATVVHSSGQGKGAGAPQASAAAGAVGTPAGLRQLELQIDAVGDELRAQVHWDSERAGQLQAQGSTRLARGPDGWLWPEDAPLAASVRAELPDVGAWSALAPPGWRVKGTLSADARLSGNRAAPRWSGRLAADQFAIRSLLDGVDLQDGRLRAQFQGDRLDITELHVKGGRGSRARIAGFSGNRTVAPQDGGTLTGSGTLSWAGAGGAGGSGIAMDLRARAQALQLLVRADRQVSVSGDLQARLQGGQLTLRGQLTTDRATILLPEAGAPALGDDVVVRSAALDREAALQAEQAAQSAQGAGRVEAARPPDIAVTLDLGEDFALQGHGITTRLTGRLDIRSTGTAGAPPRVTGEVRTVQGRYRAWGQALDVETGLLRFNGPYDNPALDVLAIRPNIRVRAGVQVTGTAKTPRVRLYADPDLPDAEKLSWVVLGRSAAGGGAEAALMQQAALALLGRGGGGGTGDIAKHIGLDEIGFKGPDAGEDATSAALTFGKRLSKDLYVTYERSLSGVLGTLYIFYDLSQHLTLRGQTGLQSAVDLIYTVRYD